MRDYADRRDIPGVVGTSMLSPHLAFGEISPRQIWAVTRHAAAADPRARRGCDKFLSEVGWREFSYHLLFHNPDLATKNFDARFDRFEWDRPDEKILAAWQKGQTGYPIVDAGMRELWATGYMHNRVRMVVASFLVKHLLIDWRIGEDWFWDTLCDADPANNAASWQWVAGCGADAAPYFRVFNPVLQGEKFDGDGAYVRRWCPELAGFASPFPPQAVGGAKSRRETIPRRSSITPGRASAPWRRSSASRIDPEAPLRRIRRECRLTLLVALARQRTHGSRSPGHSWSVA